MQSKRIKNSSDENSCLGQKKWVAEIGQMSFNNYVGGIRRFGF